MNKLNLRKPVKPYLTQYHGVETTIYNADGNLVVWIGNEVYPIDAYGRSLALINHKNSAYYNIGDQVIENVPEEKKEWMVIAELPDNSFKILEADGEQVLTESKADKIVKYSTYKTHKTKVPA